MLSHWCILFNDQKHWGYIWKNNGHTNSREFTVFNSRAKILWTLSYKLPQFVWAHYLENYVFSNVESDDAIKSHFADVTTAELCKSKMCFVCGILIINLSTENVARHQHKDSAMSLCHPLAVHWEEQLDLYTHNGVNNEDCVGCRGCSGDGKSNIVREHKRVYGQEEFHRTYNMANVKLTYNTLQKYRPHTE